MASIVSELFADPSQAASQVALRSGVRVLLDLLVERERAAGTADQVAIEPFGIADPAAIRSRPPSST